MTGLITHSTELKQHIRLDYSLLDLDRLETFLIERGVLSFQPLRSGLYSAAQPERIANKSGYQNVWIRDNIFVAYGHYINRRHDVPIAIVRALSKYFSKHVFRIDDIISGAVDPNDPMNRIHVRIEGNTLEELPEKWSHAQNDALGYFVWLFCILASDSLISITKDDLTLMEKFLDYFRTIRFWADEDSGHWEEVRKVSASSIGVVTGGLDALKTMLGRVGELRETFGSGRIEKNISLATDLSNRGRQALDGILPAECVQPEKQKRRRFDAALLFLVFPIDVVGQRMADQIIGDVADHLQGDVGIRRYIGDSYWCADYRELFSPEERSRDFSQDLERRDRLLKQGQEAQWCIFDPIISAIYGNRYSRSGIASDIEKQTAYFNRSLGQITNTLQCPEAYFIERGEYVPNDDVPLLWTQANLWLALKLMKSTVG